MTIGLYRQSSVISYDIVKIDIGVKLPAASIISFQY